MARSPGTGRNGSHVRGECTRESPLLRGGDRKADSRRGFRTRDRCAWRRTRNHVGPLRRSGRDVSGAIRADLRGASRQRRSRQSRNTIRVRVGAHTRRRASCSKHAASSRAASRPSQKETAASATTRSFSIRLWGEPSPKSSTRKRRSVTAERHSGNSGVSQELPDSI